MGLKNGLIDSINFLLFTLQKGGEKMLGWLLLGFILDQISDPYCPKRKY